MNTIYVTGLGPGDFEQISYGVFKQLKEARHLFLRTKEHPVVEELVKQGVQFQAFDDIYESNEQFEAVYEKIAASLFEEAAEKESVIYAVPGHPLVAERTVQLLLQEAGNKNCQIIIKGGQSFLDDSFAALKIDPIEGFQLVDGTDLRRDQLELNHHILICQVYDAFIASNVKLTLMEVLPDDYEVIILTAAGSTHQKVKKVKLYELDREAELNNLTSVYVPPVKEEQLLYARFNTLRRVIATLRSPEGCPWDREQTHESLKKYLVEETYEVLDAIDEQNDDHLAEELGDVLLQVMLHSQIGEDEGYFTIDDVIYGITEKMIRRHPHVFGDTTVQNAEQVVQNWEEIKKEEKNQSEEKSLLDGIPKQLPSLYQALEMQKKAAKVGFDWTDPQPIWDKVNEEMKEFQEEIREDNEKAKETEFGDLMFALVNVARFYKVDPEEAIRATNLKFKKRFQFIEKRIRQQGANIEEAGLEKLDAIWEEAKKEGL